MAKVHRKIGFLCTVVLVSGLVGCAPNQSQPRAQQAPKPNAPITMDNSQVPTTPRTQQNMGTQNTTQMRDAQNIANALVGKQNIRRANVFVTNASAYVAVDIPDQAHAQFTDQIKGQVANEVRRIDPSIQQVYVSAEPDVFTRFQGYGNELRSGKPIQGIYDQFSEFVRRIWPQQR